VGRFKITFHTLSLLKGVPCPIPSEDTGPFHRPTPDQHCRGAFGSQEEVKFRHNNRLTLPVSPQIHRIHIHRGDDLLRHLHGSQGLHQGFRDLFGQPGPDEDLEAVLVMGFHQRAGGRFPQ